MPPSPPLSAENSHRYSELPLRFTGNPSTSAAAQRTGGVIEVDHDQDSGHGFTKADGDDTESLKSSISKFKWENGRRYHAYQDGAYWAPNDDRQQEAEDVMHEMYRIVMDGNLYVAPIGNDPQSVLDVGCGTGIWAIEFADKHPSAEVLGVDLSPIQPDYVPPNCRFEIDDVNNDWTYPDNMFDFVHIRFLCGCVPDWVEFYRKALTHIRPGGWLEQGELWGAAKSDDGTLRPDSPLMTWIDVFQKIGRATGKPFFWEDKTSEWMRQGGFVNVEERVVKVPIGTWPKDPQLKQLGAWNCQFIMLGLEGFSIRGLTELLGWKYHDAQMYLVELRKEIMDPEVHSYLELTIVCGQKPEEEGWSSGRPWFNPTDWQEAQLDEGR